MQILLVNQYAWLRYRWTWLFLLVMYVAYDLARRRLTWLQFGIDLMSIVIAHMVIVGIHLCFGVNGSND